MLESLRTDRRTALVLAASLGLTACGGGGGGASTPPAPAPTVSLSANPTTVTEGSAVELGWNSSNATSCTASGGWTGTRNTSGTTSSGAINTTSTFTLSCSGAGGTAQASATVTVSGPNIAPVAEAQANQLAFAGWTVQLSGTASTDQGGTIASYSWSQTAGPAVVIVDPSAAVASFTAPDVQAVTTLTFSLTVTDDAGASSAPDLVEIIVRPRPPTVTISGRVTYERVMFSANTGAGLDYGNIVAEPARGIVVEAIVLPPLSGTTRAVTDDNGNFSLDVPGDANISLEAIAEMVRTGPPPTWDVRVLGELGFRTHRFMRSVTSGSGIANFDFALRSGWTPAGLTTTPEAAPFAILDTIRRAIDTVLAVEPNAMFPPLAVDWSDTNPGGETFYVNDSRGPRIVLAGERDVDTDEYDAHVIAHEFGHYLEDLFSRSDSIGGPHGAGDRLDMRVAFGEGWGYAFAAAVLGDPVARDSFGVNQSQSANFNIEQNGVLNPGWYSEASNWAILWDLFDAASDAGDTVSLGLGPLWQVIRGAQRDAESLTSLFPFVVALKQQNPGVAPQIDQIVSNQNIVSPTMTPWAETETNDAGASDVLPLYTPIAVGQTRIVRSAAPFGTENKLANHRYLRLDIQAQQNVRFQVSAPGARDPDILVARRGMVVGAGVEAAGIVEDFTVSLAPGTYVLDVYDCDNAGCGNGLPAQATDITVTLSAAP